MRKARFFVLAAAVAAAVFAPAASRATHIPAGPNMPYVFTPGNAGGYSTTSLAVNGKSDPFNTIRVVLGTPPCPASGCGDGPVLGTATADAFGNFTTAPITFAEGQQRIYVFANNGIRDSVPLVRDFLIDVTAPAAPVITTPLGGETFTSRVVQFTGTAESRAHVVLVDEAGLVRTTTAREDGSWSYNALFTAGPHTVTAYQDDLAFNQSPMSSAVAFTVDIDVTPPAAPTISTPEEGALTPAAVTVTGTAEPHSTVEILEDTEDGFIIYGTAAADALGDWSFAHTFTDSIHRLQARATDAAGNLGPRSAVRTWTVDAVAPRATVFKGSPYLLGTQVFYFNGDPVTGSASDNYGVASIEVTYKNLFGDIVQDNVAVCSGCPAAQVRWQDLPDDFEPGLVFVEAVAIDQVGNRSAVGELTLLVLL